MKKYNFELKNGEPLIDVLLQPVNAYKEILKAKGEKIPEVRVQAFIDTGFNGGIMIPESISKQLKVKSRGFSEIHNPHDDDRYFTSFAWDVDISIKFIGCSRDGGNVLIDETVATTVEFVRGSSDSAPQILIGQQVLQSAFFVYNGIKGFFGFTLHQKPK